MEINSKGDVEMSKKKTILKAILIFVIVVIVIGAIGVGVLIKNKDAIIKKAVVKVLSYVLQVEVKLDSLKLSVMEGKCTLEGLVIGNPEGFKTSHAFSMDKIEVDLEVKSFTTDEPVIHLVSVTNPQIILEQGFRKSNLSQLIKNASRFEGKKKTGAEEKPEAEEAQKKIRIDKVIVEGAKVSVSAPVLQGEKLSVPLPRVEINDIGKRKPVTIAEAIKIFVSAVLKEALKSGKGIIPSELDDQLKKSFDDAAETVKKDVLDKVGDGVESVTDGIKKLF